MRQIKIGCRTIAIMAFMLIGIATSFAQTTTKHIVERGETLEMIAEKYGVTKDEIVKLNPDAAQFVYVGMELVVPKGNKEIRHEETTPQQPVYSNEERTNKRDYSEENADKWNVVFEIGYGFIPKTEGVTGQTNYMYEATLGVKYNVVNGLYASMRVGYNSANYHGRTMGVTSSNTAHFVEIPLEAGYTLETPNRQFAIAPFGGIDFNIGVSGKTEKGVGKNKQSDDVKIGGKLAMGARLGLRLRLWSFNLSGAYHFSMNKKYDIYFGKDAYPEISVGWGF